MHMIAKNIVMPFLDLSSHHVSYPIDVVGPGIKLGSHTVTLGVVLMSLKLGTTSPQLGCCLPPESFTNMALDPVENSF